MLLLFLIRVNVELIENQGKPFYEQEQGHSQIEFPFQYLNTGLALLKTCHHNLQSSPLSEEVRSESKYWVLLGEYYR